ncbi:MAG: hypothetical protein NC124_03850 [Clostridium sp.]|nr:hypothetical protein [Clostridium sp.]
MNKLSKAIKHSIIENLRLQLNPKGFTILLVLCFMMRYDLDSVLHFAKVTDHKIVAATLPYLHSDVAYNMTIGLMMIYYFSEIPFIDEHTSYTLLRLGKRRWLFQKFGQIISGSIFFVLIELVCSILICLPHFTLSTAWGPVWNTITLTNNLEDIHLSRNLLIAYSPITATLRVVLMGILVATMLAFCLYALSLFFSKKAALIICAVIADGPILAVNCGLPSAYYWSPVSWIGIVEHNNMYIYKGPDIPYMVMLITIVIFICGLLSYIKIQSRDM